jgi:dihydroorotase
MPHEYDSKEVEFEYAKFGMIGLETCYPALRTAMPEISDEKWVQLLSIQPRKIFGLSQPVIEIGETAVLTCFINNSVSTIGPEFFRSRSGNSAFKGKELKGRVLGIINGDKLFLK